MQKRIILLLLYFLIQLYLFSVEKKQINFLNKFLIKPGISINEQTLIYSDQYNKLKNTTDFAVKKNPDLKIINQNNKNSKIVLTDQQKAAIIVNTVGTTLLLAGAGLLAGALVYSNHLENNETEYVKYKEGKNMSRGLFYGSMGVFGAGTVCITVSIPLFIERKNSKSKTIRKPKIKNQ